MNVAGLFRVVLWLAPILALVFFYVLTQQQEQKAEMRMETSQFDKEFAVMNKSISLDDDEKEFWSEEINKNKAEEKKQKEALNKSVNKSEKILNEIENEIKETDFDSLSKELKK